MTATVGIRPCRPDGTVATDPLMIAAAVMARGEGRTRYRWVRRKPDLVVLEFLEREPSEARARWVLRCVHGCLPADTFAERPRDWSCCDAPGYASHVPAGWSWAGDSSWSMERALEVGANKKRPDLWRLYPVSCLFAKAIKEGMKAYAPDALPLGVRIYYPEDREEEGGQTEGEGARAEGPAARRSTCPVCEIAIPVSTMTVGFAWACVASTCGAFLALDLERGVVLAEGEQVARARAWAAEYQAARLRAAPTKDARVEHGPCFVCGRPILAGAPYQAAGHGRSSHPECVVVRAPSTSGDQPRTPADTPLVEAPDVSPGAEVTSEAQILELMARGEPFSLSFSPPVVTVETPDDAPPVVEEQDGGGSDAPSAEGPNPSGAPAPVEAETPRERYVEAFIALSRAATERIEVMKLRGLGPSFKAAQGREAKARAEVDAYPAFRCPDCLDPLPAEDLDEPGTVFACLKCDTPCVATDSFVHVAALLVGARMVDHAGARGVVEKIEGRDVTLRTTDGAHVFDAWTLRAPDEIERGQEEDAAELRARMDALVSSAEPSWDDPAWEAKAAVTVAAPAAVGVAVEPVAEPVEAPAQPVKRHSWGTGTTCKREGCGASRGPGAGACKGGA